MMCILTGRAEGLRLLPAADYAIIGILTDSAKGKISLSRNSSAVFIDLFRDVDEVIAIHGSLHIGI